MKLQTSPQQQHKHTSVTLHAISQRSGVPYEIERTVCTSCHRVLGEKPLRRAAA
jgi:RNase P subunit RPR2